MSDQPDKKTPPPEKMPTQIRRQHGIEMSQFPEIVANEAINAERYSQIDKSVPQGQQQKPTGKNPNSNP